MNLDFANELNMLLHVVIASSLAGLIGLEREFSQKPAGFRTHLLIGGASALMILLGQELIHKYKEAPIVDSLQTDPLRVIEAIIVGVSFIGAGTILKVQDKSAVRYLTTASATLLSAGIGIAVALKLYVLAVGLTFFTLLITSVFGRIEELLLKNRKQNKQSSSDS